MKQVTTTERESPPNKKGKKCNNKKNRCWLFIFSGQLCASAALYDLPPRILLCSLDCLILSTQDFFSLFIFLILELELSCVCWLFSLLTE